MSSSVAVSDTGVEVLREAELFAVAEQVLVEVLGRIRETDRDIVLPPLIDLPGPSQETPLWSVVQQYVVDDANVPGVLAGGPADQLDGPHLPPDADRGDAQALIAGTAAAATAAARSVTDGDAIVHPRYGVTSARTYLLRLAVNRALVAHYVAAYLGSTACPLPEELARPLSDATRPHAEEWRALGIFRDPMPVPHLASQRDTFLLGAGHLPHPLGH